MEIQIMEKAEVCANCKRYYQHYVKAEGSGYTECYCGHCTYPRQKVRKPDDSCEHFEGKGKGIWMRSTYSRRG